MNILISNDDGIDALGIKKLAEIASKIGDVYVVAPSGNRSAVSHGITIGKDLTAWKVDFAPYVQEAYSVEGTPADCVRVGINSLLPVRPDIILSGINHGYNLGFDTLYSGTVGAAREGNSYGIKAIAVSMFHNNDYTIADKYLLDILTDLIHNKPTIEGEVWNVNLPNCLVNEVSGIKECQPAPHSNFSEIYALEEVKKNEFRIKINWEIRSNENEATDIHGIAKNYITISRLNNFYVS